MIPLLCNPAQIVSDLFPLGQGRNTNCREEVNCFPSNCAMLVDMSICLLKGTAAWKNAFSSYCVEMAQGVLKSGSRYSVDQTHATSTQTEGALRI